jgi:glucosamine-6-phosphate deaminase
MRVIIQPTSESVATWAANHVAERILGAPEGKPFVLGLPTGSTPLGMYKKLIELYKAGKNFL